MNTPCVCVMCFLLVPVPVLAGSHNLTAFVTYITGEAFSASMMLDDITVGYYDSETKVYVARGNNTNEDDVVDPIILKSVSEKVHAHFKGRSNHWSPVNDTESKSFEVYQVMCLCEQSDNKPGQIISKTAYRGSTIDERRFSDGNFTYKVFSNNTKMKRNLELSKYRFENVYYPACIKTLKNYLEKRETQVNEKVKPRVRIIQKTNSDSGGFRLSCLATGFYPRHINLTLFRDGQPVDDHEVTGGDLLPNGDGTYQMRKSLEISAADKHKYTCSATHLSLDVTLEIDPGELLKAAIPVVLIVLALVLVCATAAIVYKCRKRQADSPRSGYSATYTSEEQGKQQQFNEMA
ncbi:class I histocompatibility antigen, F10 alpha chain-like [Labeo rohita]|uniref:class I histocompatibility antigen, F10 alpha chain-like n=1 Tax=Labeo rohita TaxID=84645 RepID=UPI0021E22633|nr:class I histocompatibility antigen, F10 alpha chain-like [Labeo rohita]